MDVNLGVSGEVEGQAKTWDLQFSREIITIGRHSLNDVQIPDLSVSAEHARILVEDDRAYLLDLGSTVGTTVNGSRLGSHQRHLLNEGDEIRIASYTLQFGKAAETLDESMSEKTAMVAMRMVREVLGSLSGDEEKPAAPWIEVTNDAEVGTRLDLEELREYRIGREKDCDLVLRHWSISRKHAILRRDADGVSIVDLGSKNGVLLNGDKITDPRRLRDRDVITVGHTEARFQNPGRSALDSMDVTPTPVTDLRELGLNPPSRSAPPPEARRPEPAPRPAPAPRDDPPPMRSRAPEPETTFADYLPMIVGGLLILGAVAAALFLFVLR